MSLYNQYVSCFLYIWRKKYFIYLFSIFISLLTNPTFWLSQEVSRVTFISLFFNLTTFLLFCYLIYSFLLTATTTTKTKWEVWDTQEIFKDYF